MDKPKMADELEEFKKDPAVAAYLNGKRFVADASDLLEVEDSKKEEKPKKP